MTRDERPTRSHRDFPVWQEAMLLTETIYRLAATIPLNESSGLANQLLRTSMSIPSKIAEGAANSDTGELGHFLGLALGHAAALETELELAARLHLVESTQDAIELLENVRKQLIVFRRSLRV